MYNANIWLYLEWLVRKDRPPCKAHLPPLLFWPGSEGWSGKQISEATAGSVAYWGLIVTLLCKCYKPPTPFVVLGSVTSLGLCCWVINKTLSTSAKKKYFRRWALEEPLYVDPQLQKNKKTTLSLLFEERGYSSSPGTNKPIPHHHDSSSWISCMSDLRAGQRNCPVLRCRFVHTRELRSIWMKMQCIVWQWSYSSTQQYCPTPWQICTYVSIRVVINQWRHNSFSRRKCIFIYVHVIGS